MAVIDYIHDFDCFVMLKGSKILSSSCVNIVSCDCRGECDWNISYISAHEACHIPFYGCLISSATHITEDGRP